MFWKNILNTFSARQWEQTPTPLTSQRRFYLWADLSACEVCILLHLQEDLLAVEEIEEEPADYKVAALEEQGAPVGWQVVG